MTPDDLAKSNSEHGHQKAFFAWLSVVNRFMYDHTFAVPNGGYRDIVTAGKLKAEGVKGGVPDVFCAVPSGTKHGLFIEMKKPADRTGRKGSTQDNQDDWHARLKAQGYAVDVAYTWREAAGCVMAYMLVPVGLRPDLLVYWPAPLTGP